MRNEQCGVENQLHPAMMAKVGLQYRAVDWVRRAMDIDLLVMVG